MAEVKIITDSCADLSKDLREKFGIDYAKMVNVIDGNEVPASLDWEYYTPKELYDRMRKGERIATAQVPQEEFEKVFSKHLSAGCDIVYVGCSLRLSSSVNTGAMVAKKMAANFPNSKIFCVDSRNSSLGEGAIAIFASKLRDEGKSAAEIAQEIESRRNEMNQFCTVHSLDTLKRAGRVKASAAFFGNLFGVKPIIISDAIGNNTAIKKVKGRLESFKECVALLKNAAEGVENDVVYISHADCGEELEDAKSIVKEAFPNSQIVVGYIGPIVGASVGPGAIAFYAWGKEVTAEG